MTSDVAKALRKEALDSVDREHRVAGRVVVVGPRVRIAMQYATREDLELALTLETIPAARGHIEVALRGAAAGES